MANNGSALGKRSQEESQRTRNRILDVAEKLFAQQGFAGVSIREIARSAGLHHHTIQHHYGSKQKLYETVLNRWNDEVQERVLGAIGTEKDLSKVVALVIDVLFDFMIERRDWVVLTERTIMGADQPKGIAPNQKGWISFIQSTVQERQLGALKLDVGLLMISVEGILNNHVLAHSHYVALYGKGLDDEALKNKTKQHLQKVIAALVKS